MDNSTKLTFDSISSKINSKLHVICYPNPVLEQVSIPVPQDKITSCGTLLEAMIREMTELQGIGISAIQVGIPLRVCALQLVKKTPPQIIFNPTIISAYSECVEAEGCLSLPNVKIPIKRPNMIEVSYFDENGTEKKIALADLRARAMQHELDHMDGKLIIHKGTSSSLANRRALMELEKNWDLRSKRKNG